MLRNLMMVLCNLRSSVSHVPLRLTIPSLDQPTLGQFCKQQASLQFLLLQARFLPFHNNSMECFDQFPLTAAFVPWSVGVGTHALDSMAGLVLF